MTNFIGYIIALHNIEPYSPKYSCSTLYSNITITPEFLVDFIKDVKNNGFHFVSMEQFLYDKKNDINTKDVLITIDDGWKGVYKYAFPIFKEYNIPFLFYLATDMIENGFLHCDYAELDGMNILLDYTLQHESNTEKQEQLFNKLWKKFEHIKKLLPFLNGHIIMKCLLKTNIDFDKYKVESICSIEELKEMSKDKLCEIGSHTHNHLKMVKLNNKKIQQQHIKSIDFVENNIEAKCRHFSFPYGRFNDDNIKMVKQYYNSACITIPEFYNGDLKQYRITKNTDNYKMPRLLYNMKMKVEDMFI